MHQALYRKYRPAVFEDVYGEDHITSVLRYEASNNRFSHAYLFCGPRGTGKTTCAKILARVINCENPHDGDPCGVCPSCRAIAEGNATDVLEMDAASNTGVDYIRDIKNEISFAPAMLKKRVYIIDEVHMLSTGAFNALLKTLEEPPEHVVFILATTEFHKLPATIVSRCQRFDFRRIKTDVLASRLMYIAEKESIPLENDAAVLLAKQALGGMRDAISLFELCSAGGVDVTVERVSSVLGLTGIESLYKTAFAVAKNDIAALFAAVKQVDSSSKDIQVYWSELAGFWRDMLVLKSLKDDEVSSYLEYTEPEMRLLRDAAKRFTPEKLTYHFTLLDSALRDMNRLPQTKRLTAELTLIKMSDPSLDTSPASLLSRISSLEEKLALLESGITVNTTGLRVNNDGNDEIELDENKQPMMKNQSAPNEENREAEADKSSGSDKNTDSDEMTQVMEVADIAARIRARDPGCASMVERCDFYVSSDRMRVIIISPDKFTKNIIDSDSALQSLHSALRLCGITEAGATVETKIGRIKEKPQPIDEIMQM